MFDVEEDIRKICENSQNTRKYMKIIRKCTTNAKNAGNNIPKTYEKYTLASVSPALGGY